MSLPINSTPYINPYFIEQLKSQNLDTGQNKDKIVENQFADVFLREFLKPMFKNNWGASLVDGGQETENIYRDLLMMRLVELLKEEDAFGLREYLTKTIVDQKIPQMSLDGEAQMSADEIK
jgi:Rod binding domain-containing protein